MFHGKAIFATIPQVHSIIGLDCFGWHGKSAGILAGAALVFLVAGLFATTTRAQEFAHLLSPFEPGQRLYDVVHELSRELEEKSGRRIRVAATNLSGRASLDLLLSGDSQIAVIPISDLASIDRSFIRYLAFFRFSGLGEVENFQKTDDGATGLNRIKSRGLTGLAFWHGGMVSLLSTRELKAPEEIKGWKLGTDSTDAYPQNVFESSGANIRFLEGTVNQRAALKDKMINGLEANEWDINAFVSEFPYKGPIYVIPNHRYNGYVLTVNTTFWNELDEGLRSTLASVIKEFSETINKRAIERGRPAHEYVAKYFENLTQTNRIKPIILNDEQRAVWAQSFSYWNMESESDYLGPFAGPTSVRKPQDRTVEAEPSSAENSRAWTGIITNSAPSPTAAEDATSSADLASNAELEPTPNPNWAMAEPFAAQALERGIYWNSWVEYQSDGEIAFLDISKPNPFSIVLDLSPYQYLALRKKETALGSTEASPQLHDELKKFPNEKSLTFNIRAIVINDSIELNDSNTKQITINLETFREKTETDLARELAVFGEFQNDSEKSLHALSAALKASLVEFKIRPIKGKQGTCGLVAFSIWDSKLTMPLDYLVYSIPIKAVDQSIPVCATQAQTAALTSGANAMLAINLIHKTDAVNRADAAFHVFEIQVENKEETVAVFVDGTKNDPKLLAWRSLTNLRKYIEGDLKSDIQAARGKAANGQPFPYASVARNLRETIFAGTDIRSCNNTGNQCPNHSEATAAESALKELAKENPGASVVVRMVSHFNRNLYFPLGLLAADAEDKILANEITIIQPLPSGRYFSDGEVCIRSWNFAIPKRLSGVGEGKVRDALSAFGQSVDVAYNWQDAAYNWLSELIPFKAFFAEKGSENLDGDSEGLVVLAHHANNSFWFEQAQQSDRIKPEDRRRKYPSGSVAFLAACSIVGTDLQSSGGVLEELDEQGIHAMIASPFAVSADFSAQFAMEFVEAVNDARNNSRTPTLKTLFNTASERAADKIATYSDASDSTLKKTLREMALEYIILGDHTLRLCKKI